MTARGRKPRAVSYIDLMFLKLSENVTLYGRVKQLFCLLTPGK